MPFAVGDRVHLSLNAFDPHSEWTVARDLRAHPFSDDEYFHFVVYQGTPCGYRRQLRAGADYSGVGIFVYESELSLI